MHQSLSRSQYIFGSTQKELNLFGQPGYSGRLDDYRSHFKEDAKPSAKYFMESTPHYFHAPNVIHDVANQIRSTIPDVRTMVILRNPIERYRSAYIHHMQKGRLAYISQIDALTDDQIMLSTGLYGKILSHWLTVFPDIIVLSHDQLRMEPQSVLKQVFSQLHLDCDLDLNSELHPTHTSEEKRRSRNWPELPDLTVALRKSLADFYRDDITLLSGLVDFEVDHWLELDV